MICTCGCNCARLFSVVPEGKNSARGFQTGDDLLTNVANLAFFWDKHLHYLQDESGLVKFMVARKRQYLFQQLQLRESAVLEKLEKRER